ncbi:uncharacterized protein ALTATR162_LOCUS6026 [Alternaria atra]|uniref:Uncharacterized protein n=1 Tax=Alternaria atra TaxID=119953 RepID=A0A8J2I3M0_9PLEO|nr:uncharacterized protein ALTATR162_LOCUS6026 [Alternaria atra]CAG5161424.1 unnamed protein product [Alternaria atra]
MSTITPSEAGRAPTWDAVVQERSAQVHHQTAFIPRSTLVDSPRTRRNTLNDAGPLLNRQSYSNVNIDVPLNTQSSLHMQVTHDGKVLELVARLELYSGYSDACEGSHEDHADRTTSLDTIAVNHQEQAEHQSAAHTVSTSGHSPRKPIPTQWLPKSTGPNLATAQRAKVRNSKNSWGSDSPEEVKILRGTRSSIDLGRTHGKEGALYLTKEALAGINSTIASPTSPLSPSTLHGSPTKRPWNIPTGSPLRGSARQQHLSTRMSPNKSTHLNIESISTAHSRASSSVATSTGRVSFHTGEGSPVRSPASTEHSFQSAAENPEDLDVPNFDLKANNDDEQMHQESASPRSTTAGANTDGKRSSLTPKLALRIPVSQSNQDFHESFLAAPTVTPDGSHMFHSPLSPDSPTPVSRIPRAGATSKIAIPPRSPTIKRAESVQSLQYKLKMLQAMQLDATKVPLPETPKPVPAPLRHVRTVDSTGSTSTLSRTFGSHDSDRTTGTASEDEQKHPAHVDSPAILADVNVPDQPNNIPTCDADYDHVNKLTIDHEASKKAMKPENVPWGVPTAFDHGMTLACLISMPTIIVKIAHNLCIGNINLDAKQDEATSPFKSHIDDVENVTFVRGRSERYVPYERKQGNSGRSTQSSTCSLRATAPEFVPRPPTTTSVIEATAENSPLVSSHDLAGLPDPTVLDRNGIPFLWYMYGVQFAYEQGYRNGRPKPPKKFKQPKKQHASLSSSVNTPHSSSKAVPITNPRPAAPLPEAAKQSLASAGPMPPPPLPANRRHEQTRPENFRPGFNGDISSSHIADAETNQPFANQLNMISEQVALNNCTNSNAPRHFNVDLSTLRNVGFPPGPRNMRPPTYYTMPRHGHRNNRSNGLYGGCGNAGVPIDATAPFPNPVPPQGRPDQGQTHGTSPFDYSGYTIGKESCSLVDITVATERGGGEPCNACAPDH